MSGQRRDLAVPRGALKSTRTMTRLLATSRFDEEFLPVLMVAVDQSASLLSIPLGPPVQVEKVRFRP